METREHILVAAAEVFARRGFRGATTRRIADAAGVNEVTVFRHFGSKDALLGEAIRHTASQAPRSLLPSEPVNVRRELTVWAQGQFDHLRERSSVIRACLAGVEERPELASLAVGVPRVSFVELSAYLHTLRKRDLVARDADLDAAAAMLTGALWGDAMSRDLIPEIFPPMHEAAGAYVALFVRALGVKDSGAASEAQTRAATPPYIPDATGA